MKLAEALQERSYLYRYIDQLNDRLRNNALVQEGEEPAENPEFLKNFFHLISSFLNIYPHTRPAKNSQCLVITIKITIHMYPIGA